MGKNAIHKSCDGKIKHRSLTAVQSYIDINDKAGIEDYYLCRFCNNYHTFTIPGKEKISTKKHNRQHEKLKKLGPKKMKLYRGDRDSSKGKK